ncbi:MAG: hypothetical protein GY935_18960 [Gammaproteobacteria bacterium]|nr:hypothetical protein [Gammaproteobacteria bacterium]
MSWLKRLFSGPQVAGPARLIKRFDGSQATISSDVMVSNTDGWHIDSSEAMSVQLFEIDPGDIDNGMLCYRASIKSEQIQTQGYLEMWCRFPGLGEFFSKGLDNPIKGDNDWASYEIPFYLKKEQNPDLLKLNLTLEGAGKVWLKDIEISFTPFK